MAEVQGRRTAGRDEPGAAGADRLGRIERVASLLGGAALTTWGMRSPTPLRLLGAAVGGGLLARGAAGRCPVKGALVQRATIEVRAAVTVARSPWDVYAAWRRFEDLPRFMHHLASVEVLDARRSRWKAAAPRGWFQPSWEAELVHDEEPAQIAWRSLPGGDLQTSGEVLLLDAPAGRGTEVHVRIAFSPPGGRVGGAAAWVLRPALARLVREDVRRFKQLLEAGELPTTEGQPAGRRGGLPAAGRPGARAGERPAVAAPSRSATPVVETEALTDERPWTKRAELSE